MDTFVSILLVLFVIAAILGVVWLYRKRVQSAKSFNPSHAGEEEGAPLGNVDDPTPRGTPRGAGEVHVSISTPSDPTGKETTPPNRPPPVAKIVPELEKPPAASEPPVTTKTVPDLSQNSEEPPEDIAEARRSSPKILPARVDDVQRKRMKSIFKRKSETADRKVTQADFDVGRELGKGSFGRVMLCRRFSDGKFFAMKRIQKQHVIKNEALIQTIFTEKNIMRQNTHPFLMSLHYTFQTKEELFFILDWMQGGDLSHYLNRFPRKRLEYETVKFYAAEIVLGLMNLHEKKCIYRDLKPENILLTRDGHAVLADFGLSKAFDPNDAPKNLRTTGLVGSPFYVAPEVLKAQAYDLSIDFWSFGILLYRMMFGSAPFNGITSSDLFENIMNQEVRFLSPAPDDIKDLIKKLLQKDPKKRLTGQAVMEHAFFKGVDFAKVLAKTYRSPVPEWVMPTPLPEESNPMNDKPDASTTALPAHTSPTDGLGTSFPKDSFSTNPFFGFTYQDKPIVNSSINSSVASFPKSSFTRPGDLET